MSVLELARAARQKKRIPDEKNEENEISPESSPELLQSKPVHPIPSGCTCRIACPVLGICGRTECIDDGEADRFAAAVEAARSPDNPHRIVMFGPRKEQRRAS